jgi:hypothetical protein
MKKLLTAISSFLLSTLIQAQELPTPPSNGFAFPLGSKFTIKLFPVDTMSFNYSVIAFEPFREIVDSWNHDDLYTDQGQDSTITFYFCMGTHGDSEKDKKENMKILLLFKNYSKFALTYLSDIQKKEDGEFEPTSNVGTYPGATGTEIWPYMIQMIGLREFKKKN